MIKRPLVYILAAFVIGSLMTTLGAILSLSLIFILGFFLYRLFIRMQKGSLYVGQKEILNIGDAFLCTLPVFMLLGFILMQTQLKEPYVLSIIQLNNEVVIEGDVTKIEEKNKSTALTLTDVKIKKLFNDSSNQEDLSVYSHDINQVLLSISKEEEFYIGNTICVYGQIVPFSRPTNLGQFNEYQYYKIRNYDFKIQPDQITVLDDSYCPYQLFLQKLKIRLIQVYEQIVDQKDAGTLSAMLLGEKSLLDTEIKDMYQENGISHILAISGLHITMLGMFFYHLIRKIGAFQTPACIITMFFVISYGVLTNFSISTNRAVVMLIVALLAKIIGRTYDFISGISLSALLILIQGPMQMYDGGFLLSFGAVAAIAVVVPILKQLFITDGEDRENGIIAPSSWFVELRKALINGLLMSLSVQLVTTPILLSFFYELPLYSILINLIIIPLATLLLLLALFGALTGLIWLLLGRFFIGGAHYILEFYEIVCKLFMGLPYNMICIGKPATWSVLIYYTVLVLFLLLASGVVMVPCFGGNKSKAHPIKYLSKNLNINLNVDFNKQFNKKWYLLLLIGLFIIFLRVEKRELTVTFLDVGQGDGAFIRSASNTTYLIDGGSSSVSLVGKYRIEPFLKYQGINKIDYVILSHADQDHISGVLELLADMVKAKRGGSGIRVNYLCLPYIEEKDEGYLQIEYAAKEAGVKLIYLNRGDKLLDGELKITCLHPSVGYHPESTNSYSTVLSLEYGEFQALFTGDLEKDGEMLLMEARDEDGERLLKDYDVLKVAHHGSKNSTTEEFLAVARPEYAVISCGVNNRYGHPHKELLERIQKEGSMILSTANAGAITFHTNGKKLKVERMVKKIVEN